MSTTIMRRFLMMISLMLTLTLTAAEPVHIRAVTGLQYDVTQFKVDPGASVTIVLENADTTDMQHNLVITKPERRMEVVNAALALGADALTVGYVPTTPDVLFSIPLVSPNESKTLTFTAPAQPGIYPYVCTFPGHGLIMFGAMYVGVDLPAAKAKPVDDGAVPPSAPSKRPTIARIFMPDSGPAAIAVALLRDENYCWDAGQCRFRYAWRGGFIDIEAYAKGNGNATARILGERSYTAPQGTPLRFSREVEPKTRFRGYALRKGIPEFHYEIDGVEVHEYIHESASSHGLVFDYQVASDQPLSYRVDPQHASWFSSSVGAFADGVLAIPAKQGRSFTITLNLPEAKP